MNASRLAVAAIACAIALSACTSARPMMAPSGARGIQVWCEVPSQCYERAAKECPYGYVIEAKEKDQWGWNDVDGNLFIVCKQPGEQSQQLVPRTTSNGSTPPPPTSELDPAKRCDACQKIGKP